VSHWINKAKQTAHLIRAATSRFDAGLGAMVTQRLLTACLRSPPFHGIEHWGGTASYRDLADRFSWTVVRRIFNLPRDTPVRAISVEFGLETTQVVFDHRKSQLAAREAKTGIIATSLGLVAHTEGLEGWESEFFGDGICVDPFRPKTEMIREVLRRESRSFETDLLIYTDASRGCVKIAAVGYPGGFSSKEGEETSSARKF
jgi:hypothetical protein